MTLLNKVREGFWGNRQLTRRQKIANSIAILVIIYGSGFLGGICGYRIGTGTWPIISSQESIVPPEIQVVSAGQLDSFIKEDQTNLEKYREGFNCVEFALQAAREAMWKGVPATVIRLDFEGSSFSHWILGFATVDEGWKFYEPQMGSFVNPRVGGMFMDKKIVGVFYLYDFVWKPIEVEK